MSTEPAPAAAKTRLAFTVLRGTWTAGEFGPYPPAEPVEGLGPNEVVINDPSPELITLAGHAHAAGVIDVTEGLDTSTVQTQEDGELAYEAAQASGEWQKSNQAQWELEQAKLAPAVDAAPAAVEPEPATKEAAA